MHAAAGFELSKFDLSLSGGLGAALYANIAEFTATGTANNDSSKEKCDVALVEGFTMALGAQAGATVVFDSSTWGPVAATETPIWYTELTTACATLRSSSPPTMTSSSSPAAAITARQADGSDDASITTTETTYSIVSCISPGLMNCPVSDQTTLSYATILTTTLAAQTSIISTKSFGTNKQDFTSTSGPLKSYSPPPPSATSTGGGVGANGGGGRGGRVGGKDEKPLIIGMSVGLGVPALAVVAGAIFCLVHRRIKSHRRPTRKSKTGSGQVEETTATTATPGLVPEEQGFLQKTPTVVST